MNDTIKLKPCPFCGGEAHLVEYSINTFVACTKCKSSSDDSGIGVYFWNKRIIEDDLVATLKAISTHYSYLKYKDKVDDDGVIKKYIDEALEKAGVS